MNRKHAIFFPDHADSAGISTYEFLPGLSRVSGGFLVWTPTTLCFNVKRDRQIRIQRLRHSVTALIRMATWTEQKTPRKKQA